MLIDLLIDLDDDLLGRLEMKAKIAGRSCEELVRDALELGHDEKLVDDNTGTARPLVKLDLRR